jgi:thioredoxin-related protein
MSIWIVLFLLLGLYLLGIIRLPHDDKQEHVSVPRLMLALASLAFAMYMVPGLWGANIKAISAFAPPTSTQDFNLNTHDVKATFTSYEAGMETARLQQKPVLIDFSGYGCVNCRKMESSVWQAPSVRTLLQEDFVLITLMVDDKTPLPAGSYTIIEDGTERSIKTVGDHWSYLQRHKFGANAQPYYVILDQNGLPLSPSRGYNEDVDAFTRFLKDGLTAFKKVQKPN